MTDVSVANRDLSLLAPKFREAVTAALADCAGKGLTAKVNEGFRSNARQAWLYAQGRTRPGKKVTNAPTALTSWHGYGLAVDIIHQTKGYEPFGPNGAANEKWFADVAAVFKQHSCNWGGDWTNPDTPHMQWGKCRPSPSDKARELIAAGGVEAVWKAVSAV
ncbi:MAG: hypothetical protein JWR84_532 [Caulobacter sp.]|nr:hypothetical protein [Caulobacter sp.]